LVLPHRARFNESHGVDAELFAFVVESDAEPCAWSTQRIATFSRRLGRLLRLSR
jgi:hypothetical protein